MKTKRKKSNKEKKKEKLWKLVSEYVRRKDADPHTGMVECYTCGVVKHWKQVDAGHAIGGRNNMVLFDLSILRPQCKSCNGPGERGNYYVFGNKLNKENGEGWYEQKKIEARQSKKIYESDLEDMIESMTEMVKELE